jgi:F-type H+-transporting ATPase subunit b
MELLATPEFWVAVSFLLFIGVLVYFRVFNKLGELLDRRAALIAKELEEARRLRDEAQQVLADYRKKEQEAEAETRSIVDLATKEAQALAEETRRSLKEQLGRRTKLAEEKIARAEAQAVREVQEAAIEAAVLAAQSIIADKLTPDAAKKLVEQSIEAVKTKLH